MCVLALAWRAHPHWRLVLAGNRDERHARAEPLHRWAGAEPVLAGRDLESGGAWLGVSEQGRFAVVTNLQGFGARSPAPASRGALVADALTGRGRYAHLSLADLDDFNSFNLIAIDGQDATFWSNRPAPLRQPMPPGLYGLSNGGFDEPWPKTERLKASLAQWLDGPLAEPLSLLDALADETRWNDPLPSPIFVRDPVYGTRCSTVAAIDHAGRGEIIERRFTADGSTTGETRLSFAWPA